MGQELNRHFFKEDIQMAISIYLKTKWVNVRQYNYIPKQLWTEINLVGVQRSKRVLEKIFHKGEVIWTELSWDR